MPWVSGKRRSFHRSASLALLACTVLLVSCWERDADLDVNPVSLNFGSLLDSLTFSCANAGQDGALTDGVQQLEYTITTDQSWVSVTPTAGKAAEGYKNQHVVRLDRSLLALGDNLATINVSSNGGSQAISVRARRNPDKCFDPPTTPQNPLPTDNATGVSVTVDLGWNEGNSRCPGLTATYDVYFGNTSPPPFSHNNGTSKSWDPGLLDPQTSYYWRVVAIDSNGRNSGAEWNFRTQNACSTPPGAPVLLTPANNANGVGLNEDLTWAASTSPCGLEVTYDVYFGTSSPPPLVVNNGSATVYEPGTLLENKIYYWRVIATDANGGTTSAEWKFRTALVSCLTLPTAPTGPTPVHDATGVGLNQDLSWTAAASTCPGLTVTYDVYFGTASPPPFSHNNGTATTWDPGTLIENKLYYWRVVAKDANGPTSSAEWKFRTAQVTCTTLPTPPTTPVPTHNATSVAVNADLGWSAGVSTCAGLTATYDVYFGTTSPPPFSHNNGSTKTWDPGLLANNTSYYWRVVAKDANGSTSSTEWTFRTEMIACTLPPTKPGSPSPGNLALAVSLNANLSWSAAASQCPGLSVTYDVYFGTTTPPPFSHNNGAATTWDPGVLNAATIYYWRVVAKDANGSTSSSDFLFTTELLACTSLPTAPVNPTPDPGEPGVAVGQDLVWTGGTSTCAGLTATYDVYFGTTSPPPFSHNNGSTKTWDPGTLEYSTTYYWRVVAKDANGSTTSATWNFVTGVAPCVATPTAASTPVPGASASNVDINQNLGWGAGVSQCAGLTATYDVHFGTTSPPPLDHNNGTSKTWDPGTLAHSTTYFWQIVATDANGSTPGPIWSFTTEDPCLAAPTAPCTPSPTNGRDNANENSNLAWQCGVSQCEGLTATYDVYFGTNPTPGTAEFRGTTSSRSFDLPRLDNDVTYYWRIVARDANGSTQSPIWRFTTRSDLAQQ